MSSYKKERIEVLPHTEALKLGERRKRGRPKKIGTERPRKERVVQVQSQDEVHGEEEDEQILLAEVEELLLPAAKPLLPSAEPFPPAAQPLSPADQALLPIILIYAREVG